MPNTRTDISRKAGVESRAEQAGGVATVWAISTPAKEKNVVTTPANTLRVSPTPIECRHLDKAKEGWRPTTWNRVNKMKAVMIATLRPAKPISSSDSDTESRFS